MQWQRVFHGFGAAVQHAGRIHSVYEFTLPQFPQQIVRIKVVETPEGQYHAIADQCITCNDEGGSPQLIKQTSPELALREALEAFIKQATTVIGGRLQHMQYW